MFGSGLLAVPVLPVYSHTFSYYCNFTVYVVQMLECTREQNNQYFVSVRYMQYRAVHVHHTPQLSCFSCR